MYLINLDILIKQYIPPNWRWKTNTSVLTESGQFRFLQTIFKPFKTTLTDFKVFRKQSTTKINLTPETMIVENHLAVITGVGYGISITDDTALNNFIVNVPNSALSFENEIKQFMNRITPLGRKFTINFY